MILVWGEDTDAPVARVLEELQALAADVVHLDGAIVADMRYRLSLENPPKGWIECSGRRIDVAAIGGIYLRPGPATSAPSRRASEMLLALASLAPAVVLNRPSADRSNHSKPYQLTLIARAGFRIPSTLVTTDPMEAQRFLDQHGTLIYKSVSGTRSIVAKITRDDAQRLGDVAHGPVQFQEYVEGLDVRVHVVGNRWFACAVRSDAVDYRYAATTGGTVEFEEFELPPDVGEKTVALARFLGLGLAGVDLRLTANDQWVCFEVNPSPGFPYYEDATEHRIAATIAAELLGA